VDNNVSEETGNAPVDATAIWSNADQLYLQTEKAGKASIYTISGILKQVVPLAAGETATVPLAKGFYVVTVHNKAYKVIVK
jgi:hypothetical protein